MTEQYEVTDWWQGPPWRLLIAPKIQTSATVMEPGDDGSVDVTPGVTEPDPDWQDGDLLIFWQHDEQSGELGARILTSDVPTMELAVGRPGCGRWLERRYRLVDDEAIPTGHVVLHDFDDDPLTRKVLTALGLSDLKDQMERHLRVVARRLDLGEEWEAATVKAKRPGQRGMPELELAQWAERYAEALEADPRRPYKLLADRYPGWSDSALKAIIHRARSAGYLTRVGRGQTGGELTERARALLTSNKEA